MVYSFKTILFISTTVLSTTAYSTFLFPALFTDFFDFYVISSILSTSVLVLTQKQSASFQNTFSDTIILSSQYQPLVFLHKDFSLKSLTIFLPSIDFFFNLLNFIIIFFFIDLFQNIFLSSNKSFFWFKPFNFLKTSFFLSYTFMTSIDALVSFTYFFFSLYFLELHFFFIFTFNLTSDSIVYQFNFLLSSFFFIFLVKTIRTLFEKGFLFSMNFHFNEFFVFNSSKVAPLTLSLKAKTSFFEEDDLLTISRFFLRIFFFVFFFF